MISGKLRRENSKTSFRQMGVRNGYRNDGDGTTLIAETKEDLIEIMTRVRKTREEAAFYSAKPYYNSTPITRVIFITLHTNIYIRMYVTQHLCSFRNMQNVITAGCNHTVVTTLHKMAISINTQDLKVRHSMKNSGMRKVIQILTNFFHSYTYIIVFKCLDLTKLWVLLQFVGRIHNINLSWVGLTV